MELSINVHSPRANVSSGGRVKGECAAATSAISTMKLDGMASRTKVDMGRVGHAKAADFAEG